MNAIYCRVSTDEQARKGYSLTDQIQSCRTHLLAMGESISNEYIDDGYSGEFLERPGLEKLLQAVRTGTIKKIAVYDPDRLSRNLTNQLLIADEIEKSGATLTFVTGDYDCSPEGRLFFSMKGAIAAYEKAKIRERTCRGRRAKASSGKIVSNSHPFGYDWNKTASMYTINEQEAAVVRMIYDMCITNGWGAKVIAFELSRQHICGRNGRPLSVSTISRILTKEMYCGRHYLFKQNVRKTGQNTREICNNPPELWIPIDIPPIVSRQQWNATQKQVQKNKKLARRNTKRNYLLQGLIRCAICGRSMVAYGRYGKRKIIPDKLYQYYSCITKESNSYSLSGNRCQCRRIPAKELDTAVWSVLIEIASPKLSADSQFRDITENYKEQIDHFLNRETALKHKQSNITTWYRNNLLDITTAEHELKIINKQLAELAVERTAFEEQKKAAPPLATNDFSDILSFPEKRNCLLSLPYKIKAVRYGELIEFWLCE